MDNFINDLFDILKINTVYSDDEKPFGKGNKECLKHMLDLGLKYGFNVKNIDDYAGYIEFGEGKEMLGILCHIDVVDVNNSWNTDPFNPTIIDNKIYARGVNDDKGPLMCALYAMKRLKDEGFIPNKRVRLIMGCNEESDFKCMERYLKTEEKPTMSFSPDAEYPVIYGEKGILTIKIKGKCDSKTLLSFNGGLKFNIVPGEAHFTLSKDYKDKFYDYINENMIDGKVIENEYILYGKPAHAMNPEKGINAITLAFDFLKTISKSKFVKMVSTYFTNDTNGKRINAYSKNDEMGELTANLAILSVSNGDAEFIINYRLPDEKTYDKIIKNIKKILIDSFSVEVLDYLPIHYVDPNGFLVKTLHSVYQKNTNDYESKPMTIGGGTYAKTFENSVAFGILFPGEEDVAHIDNEYESIDSLNKSIDIIYDAIKELTK